MCEEQETTGEVEEAEVEGFDADAVLHYEPNPKHKDPWQRGQRGSLCDPSVHDIALELLRSSVVDGQKRFAVHEGRAYCAQEHAPNTWHGYPVGWREVPSKLVRTWFNAGLLTKRDKKRHWEGHG